MTQSIAIRASMPGRLARLWPFLILALLLALTPFFPAALVDIPDWAILPIADRLGKGLDWFARDAMLGPVSVQDITRGVAAAIDWPIRATIMILADGYVTGAGFNKVQLVPPLSWVGVIAAVCVLANRLSGPGLAAMSLVAGLYIVLFGYWTSAMITLANVALCVVMALILGLALGIWSYRSPRAEWVLRGLMNIMQTVPIFSYLIPTLLLFGYGPSAALAATVIYALPPMLHATVLALQSVPQEVRELARMSGCTQRQTLWQVELPVALPKLAIGLNQTVMMSLNMVIIASMIGAGGLGFDVLQALRRLDIGVGLEAGMAIVALAVVLDRLTQAAARAYSAERHKTVRRGNHWLVLGLLSGTTIAGLVLAPLGTWPKEWILSTAPMWNSAISWINVNYFDALETFRTACLLWIMYPLRDTLLAAPFTVVIAAVALVGGAVGGLRVTVTCTCLLASIAVSGFWDAAMVSAYLVILSVFLALLVGLPLGIWLARRPRLAEPARLLLDTLQTLPTLVYLLPAVMLFRNGDFSALIAISTYAVAPAIRYGMEGLARVPQERLEAAAMMGCTRRQAFRAVELPAAMPTLILGINQTMMMALSMLVVAALVGTSELGQAVFTALSQGKTGNGIVAGLAVAALALTADTILVAWTARKSAAMGLARP
jgi:glycine betaine/proline transport system permease protein